MSLHNESVTRAETQLEEGFESKISAILKEIRNVDANLVILNEDHNDPYTRLISSCFIPHLNKEGFSVLAAETFATPNPALLQINPTLPGMGYYTNSPNFDLIIDAARAYDWRLLAYETPKAYRYPDRYLDEAGLRPQINNVREFTAAQNILFHLKNNPKDRLFLHVGHAHVYKGHTLGTDGYTMDKAWLAELIDREPSANVISIDQIPIDAMVSKMENCVSPEVVFDDENMTIKKWNLDGQKSSCSMYVDFTIDHKRPINSCN